MRRCPRSVAATPPNPRAGASASIPPRPGAFPGSPRRRSRRPQHHSALSPTPLLPDCGEPARLRAGMRCHVICGRWPGVHFAAGIGRAAITGADPARRPAAAQWGVAGGGGESAGSVEPGRQPLPTDRGGHHASPRQSTPATPAGRRRAVITAPRAGTGRQRTRADEARRAASRRHLARSRPRAQRQVSSAATSRSYSFTTRHYAREDGRRRKSTRRGGCQETRR